MAPARVAFVFPGQGSQEVGMGADLYAASEEARHLFAEADRLLGFSLSDIIRDGPEERLRLTEYTQPALLLVSVALHRALGREAAAVAGHSLGEYSAAVAAGALEFADAIRLVHKRGRYMQEAVPAGAGAMVAVLGVDEDAIRAAIAAQGGGVDVANYNAPGNIVIAGARAATLQVAAIAGGKARELAVSAPFHSRQMASAEAKLAADLDATSITAPRVPLYNNVDAARVTTAADVRDGLKRQVTRSVRWTECVLAMAADGIESFVEIGPGRVLTGLIRRIAPQATRLNASDVAGVEATRLALAG